MFSGTKLTCCKMSGREKLGEEKGPMVIWSILYDLLNMVEEISVTQSQNNRALFYSYYILQNKTEGRKTHRQAATKGGCSKGPTELRKRRASILWCS